MVSRKNLPLKYRYGFEIEQPNIPDAMRYFTRTNSGIEPKYKGHTDCGNWEVGTFKPMGYKSTIRQLDKLFYSDIAFLSQRDISNKILGIRSEFMGLSKNQKIKIRTAFEKGKLQDLITDPEDPGVINKKIPFKWWNRAGSRGYGRYTGTGSHVHVSLNFTEMLKSKATSSIDVKKVFDNYLIEWISLFNIYAMFHSALMPALSFTDTPRSSPSEVIYWAGHPAHKIARRSGMAKSFSKQSKDEWFKYIVRQVWDHPYVSPSPRNIKRWDFSNYPLTSRLSSIDNVNINAIPFTIELRANENFYYFAGEILRRFNNFVSYIIKELRENDNYFGSNRVNKGNINEKNGEFSRLLDNDHGIRYCMRNVKNIDLGRDYRYGQFYLPQKYPSMEHLSVRLFSQLRLFGKSGREVPELYMHHPGWHKNNHDIIWHFRSLVKNYKFKVEPYLSSGGPLSTDRTTGAYRFAGKKYSRPNTFLKKEYVKKLILEIKKFNR